MLLHKNRAVRAPAKRFDADGARARIEIHKRGAFHGRAQNIEQRFPQAIARRPQQLPLQAAQRPAPVFSGDHSHGETLWNRR